jgi:putative ABC transport system permease protein
VFIGVLFIAATLTITDTVQSGFGSLFSNAYRNVSVVVREKTDVVRRNEAFRGRIDESLVDTARNTPGVAAAEPRITGYAYVVSARGVAPANIASDTAGAPIAENWISDAELNPYSLVSGTAPKEPGDVVIDRGTANGSKIAIGESINIVSRDGSSPGKVVGIVRFGSVDSPGAVPVVLFTKADAQRVLGEPGRIDEVLVRRTAEVVDTALALDLQQALPDRIEAVTGKTVTRERENQVANGLRFITTFLLVFAVLSLVVGAFIIANTFAISISQRARELALLRAIGAARSQITRMMLGEAVVMAIAGSVLGLFGGIALASGLRVILRWTGVDLPPSPLVVLPQTVAWSLGIGFIVTLLAAMAPAIRAGRTSPVAAMRDNEVEPPPLLRRTLIGAALAIVGALIMRSGALLPSLTRTGQGVALLFVGVLLSAPAVSTLARFLVSPAQRALGPTTGLAVRNSTRNPRRTASTALALSLGSAVACFAVILNSSLQTSLKSSIGGGLKGDLVVRSGSFGVGGLPTTLAGQIAALPMVEATSGLRYGFATVDGPKRAPRRASAVARTGGRPIASLNPAAADRLLDFGNEEGRFADLGKGTIAVSRRELDSHGWNVGDTIDLGFPGKTKAPFRISTVYRQGLAFDFAIGHSDYERLSSDQFDFVVYVAKKPGANLDQLRTEIAALVKAYPTAKIDDPKTYVARIANSLDQLLSLIFGLLVLVVVVAVLGIAITLSLSVVERLREIGLLRTLGMSRRQVRSMLQSEAIVISLLAVSIGVVLGTAMSWALLNVLRDEGLTNFSFPPLGISGLALLAAIAGLIASIVPARRAARLPMLTALEGLSVTKTTSSDQLPSPTSSTSFASPTRRRAIVAGVLAIGLIAGFVLGRASGPRSTPVAGSVTTAGNPSAGSATPNPGDLDSTDRTGGFDPTAGVGTVGTGSTTTLVSNDPYPLPPTEAGAPLAEPGTLVSAMAIDAPPGLKAWRVLFHSTIRDDQPTVVSGLVYAPDRPAPEGGWPVLSFAHPTVGLADRCAPSRAPGILETTVASLVGQLDMAVVSSDYPGLGTEGEHPFLDGISSGRSILDATIAARSIRGLTLSSSTVLWGHSQGGHAALFAAKQAARYAPSLKIGGVVAGAPPSQLRTLVGRLQTTPDRGYSLLIARGLAAVNPTLKLADVLTPRGVDAAARLDTECSSDVIEATRRDTLLKSPTLPEPWLAALDANEPGDTEITSPVLIIHGGNDELVPVGSSAVLAEQLTKLGTKVERKVYPEAGHADVALTSLTDVVAWISAHTTRAASAPKTTTADANAAAKRWPGATGRLKEALDRGATKTLVIAHAGGDLEAPHSTPYAFERSAQLGADVLEMDVRLSSDNVLIIQHDPDVDRTTNDTGPVATRTAAQLATLDNGYWFTGGCWDCRSVTDKPRVFRGVRTGATPPPTGYAPDDFRIVEFDVIARKYPDMVLDIEIKTDGPDKGIEVARALAKRLQADPKPDRFLVVSFDDAALAEFRKQAPAIATSSGFGEITRYVLSGQPLNGVPVLQIPPDAQGLPIYTEALRKKAAADGIALWVWPSDPETDDVENYRLLLATKPNGIIAGRPGALKSLTATG